VIGPSPLLPLLALILAADRKPVTLEAVANYRPEPMPAPIWSPAGKRFVFREGSKLLLFDAPTNSRSELLDLKTLEDAAKTPPEPKRFEWQNRRVSEQDIQWMPDGQRLLVLAKGDLFLVDVNRKSFEPVTATPVAERDPKPSPDGKRIAYRIEHDLYSHELASGKVSRLTTDGSENLLNGELDWVYPEELEIGTAYWWSPDSARIAYLQFDTSRIETYPHNDLASTTAFAEPQKYPKAGTPNSDVRLGVIAATGGPTRWLDLGDPRDRLIARVDWTPQSDAIFIQRLNRIQNRLDLLTASISGPVRTVLTESDPAWINVGGGVRFLPARQEFLWSSERSGFRHLYAYSLDGKSVRRLTNGEWEVKDIVAVDEKAGRVWFVSNEGDPLRQDLWAVNLDGGGKRKLTAEPGTHTVSMSPTADYYLATYSSLSAPRRATLHSADGKQLAELKRQSEPDVDLLPVEVARVKAPDGALMYARLIKPAGFDPAKKYPAVVMVYGGPHAQTVRDQFAGVSWEQALAHRGFVVWGLDNRGSAGRGHAWEAKLHRRFGRQEVADQKAGVEHLLSLGFVDKARIGIYGWSYGGYMTLYSLLTEPDLFAAGIAGAPVTDWRNYDTIYTERYLGLPQENDEGYRQSSPVTHAANLKSKLLLVHNYGDDNVLFQHTFQMADALQRAGKQFELMIYPQKAHGVSGPARLHLNQLMTSFFERTLKGN
jgi:dipeptidyl-peptidase-4